VQVAAGERMPELNDENNIQEYRYYCKLFDDMITRTPCLLRRRELNGKSTFVCGGCSKDTMMNSPRKRIRAQQELSGWISQID
jgi:hypothetical protein